MWKDRLYNLLGRRNPRWRDIMVFLMSLLLAFGIWLIHNLSLNYSDTMSVPVIAECNLDGHSNVSSNSNMIAARCRTTGFALLRNHHRAKKDAIHVKFDTKDMHHKDGEQFYITAAELTNYVGELYGDGVRLESFLSETVQFRFPYENNRRVPVEAVSVLSFRPQYMAVGRMKLQPDSVTVYGEPLVLEKIDAVFTRSIELTNLKSSAHGSVKLEPVAGVRFSSGEVSYSLDVSRYVEVKAEIAVGVRNVPSGKKISVLPSTASVIFKCEFPMSHDPSNDVSLYVDWRDFESSKSGKCVPHATRLPSGVIEYSISPEVFDVVEEGKQ